MNNLKKHISCHRQGRRTPYSDHNFSESYSRIRAVFRIESKKNNNKQLTLDPLSTLDNGGRLDDEDSHRSIDLEAIACSRGCLEVSCQGDAGRL